MNLYILRHAKAEPRSDKYKPDNKRPLTPLGEETARAVAKGMGKLDLSFDLIITSPYLRAAKTAEITAKYFKTDKVWTTPSLTPEGDPSKLIDEITDNYESLNDILLVGHEPYLTKLIAALLSGEEMRINLKKSGLCKLSIEDLRYGPCACLEWLLTPRQLQKLGK